MRTSVHQDWIEIQNFVVGVDSSNPRTSPQDLRMAALEATVMLTNLRAKIKANFPCQSMVKIHCCDGKMFHTSTCPTVNL